MKATPVTVVVLALGLLASPTNGAEQVSMRASPPGQIAVVTVNARQKRIVGPERFEALFELAIALRNRPPAFDGGFDGAVETPDVVIVQEMRPSNLEIFERQLREKFDQDFRTIGSPDADAQLIANLSTVRLDGEVQSWDDVCLPRDGGTDDERFFQWAPLVEIATSQPFVVAGVHFSNQYKRSGQPDCLIRNVQALRDQFAAELSPVIVGGDFNKRSVEVSRECDPNEQSPPFPWWSALVTPTDGGRTFVDAVRQHHRTFGESMESEWTFERHIRLELCTGESGFRRSRLDYLFASGTAVGDAHADHPGWSGTEPGTKSPENFKYSDHRFVAGRFVLGGPPQPSGLQIAQLQGGSLSLSWSSQTGVESWLLYKAIAGHAYQQMATLPPETLTFEDSDTAHGTHYRYAVAAITGGAQGLESAPARERADARGPIVIGVNPNRAATDVLRSSRIEAFFDEPLDGARVSEDAIKVFRGIRRVAGTIEQTRARKLVFTPTQRLARSTRYRIVVRAQLDLLGNRGLSDSWRFVTGKS